MEGIQLILPTVQIYGCYFHLSQAVWKKVQTLGLQVTCTEDNSTYKFIQKFLALLYLPAEHIQPIFIKLQEKAINQPLIELNHYIFNMVKQRSGILYLGQCLDALQGQ